MDVKYARKLGIQKLPCVGLFRNGDFQAFTGDLKNEINVLNWLSDIETLEIPGVIEEVNSDMLLNIVTLEDDVLVFFYDPEDKDSEDILNELETIDDNLDEEEVEFVKCSEPMPKETMVSPKFLPWFSLRTVSQRFTPGT